MVCRTGENQGSSFFLVELDPLTCDKSNSKSVHLKKKVAERFLTVRSHWRINIVDGKKHLTFFFFISKLFFFL